MSAEEQRKQLLSEAYGELDSLNEVLGQAERQVADGYRWMDKVKSWIRDQEEKILELGGKIDGDEREDDDPNRDIRDNFMRNHIG